MTEKIEVRYRIFLQSALVILLCLIIYTPSLWNGFIWDDDQNLYKSLWMQRTNGLKVIWLTQEMYQYYPITFTSFWLEHKLWDLNPFGYHAVNLILHILNALLFFRIASKIYPRLAFISVLLFAIHPIQVETVAWITERKNLLSLFFFLLAVLAYLRFDRTQRRRYYLLTVVMFVCALLSKTIAVCFIFIPILYKWWRDGRVTWRDIGLSIIFAITGFLGAVHALYLEFYHVGAQGKEFALTFLERLLLSGRALFFYIYKIFLPLKFIFFYPSWIINIRVWWQWLFFLAVLLVLSALVYYRKKTGRGALALFIFYLISIFPVLGFMNVYGMRFSFVADHFSYLSTPALLLLLCAGITFLFDRLMSKSPLVYRGAFRILKQGLFILIAIYMCGKSTELTRNYKDQITLWNNLIRENPKAWMAYNNLAVIYNDMGRNEEAVPLYKKAIEIKPNYAMAYNNLAVIYSDMGRKEEAVPLYKKAIEIKPNHVGAYNNLANLYSEMGRNEEAVPLYKKAIEIKPNYARAYNNLANLYSDMGRNEEAINAYQKAIEINPNYASAHFNLSSVYFYKKEYDLALKHCDMAIQLGYKVASDFLELLKPYRK